jgi:hypothetical protein
VLYRNHALGQVLTRKYRLLRGGCTAFGSPSW